MRKLCFTGNNAGDLFEFCLLNDGRVQLKVGHCCVFVIDHIVPVEFLTALLAKAVIDAGDIKEAMRTVDWPADYVDSLVAQIESAR